MTDENDEISVPTNVISSVSRMLDNQQFINERQFLEDTTIKTKKQLIMGLKQGTIPGSAMLEWSDTRGKLRANVIDYLVGGVMKAIDPKSGEEIVIKAEILTDNTWGLLY